MTERSWQPSPRIAVLGTVPAWFSSQVGPQADHAWVEPENLFSRLSARTELLAIGLDLKADALARVLPSIRVAFPTLVIVALHDERPQHADAQAALGWVDASFSDARGMREFLDVLAEKAAGATSWRSRGRSAVLHVANTALPFAVLLSLWALVVAALRPPAYLLPSPLQVIAKFFDQADLFLIHVLTTAYEAFAGFIIGNILGIGLAIVLTRQVQLRRYTLPVLISLQAIPVVAFAPLLGVWLGSGLLSKIAMATIICFFPMVVNTLQAFANVEKDFLELFALYRSAFGVKLRRLLLPAAAPSIVAALKISAGLSVLGAIVAEMIGADRGLGYLILSGAYRLETDVLFVAMVLSAVLGVTFFQLPRVIARLLPAAWMRGIQVKEAEN